MLAECATVYEVVELSRKYPVVYWPVIKTLEGMMSILPDTYIITGVQGERYLCKQDIFEQTYELAEGGDF